MAENLSTPNDEFFDTSLEQACLSQDRASQRAQLDLVVAYGFVSMVRHASQYGSAARR